MSGQHFEGRRYRFIPIPGPAHQNEYEQVGGNQSIVRIPSKGAKLWPERITTGLLNCVLFMAATSFLVLGVAAKWLDGKSVRGTPWGEFWFEASQYVKVPSIFVSDLT